MCHLLLICTPSVMWHYKNPLPISVRSILVINEACGNRSQRFSTIHMKIQCLTHSWTCVYLLSVSQSSSFKEFHHHSCLFIFCLSIPFISCPVIAVHTSAVIGMFCWVCPASYTAQPRHDVHSPGLWPSQCVIFQVWCGWYHRWVCPSFSQITVYWHLNKERPTWCHLLYYFII